MKTFFKNKKAVTQKLLDFGFKKNGQIFVYEKPFLNNSFMITVKIDKVSNITTEVVEIETADIYTLHLTDAEGSFIGEVREEYSKILEEIEKECFEPDIFKFPQTKKYIEYLKEKYNTDIEYLWPDTPDNGVARRKDTSKWYAAILTVKKDRLGFETSEKVEVIDIRANVDDVPDLLKRKDIYPAYHMNKKHWITIILDGSVSFDEICKMTEISYQLAK